MHEELQAMGANGDQVWDFFRYCLQTNTIISQGSAPKYSVSKDGSSKTRNIVDQGSLNIKNFLRESISESPAWFKGDRNKWSNFLINHASFANYLYPEEEVGGLTSYRVLDSKRKFFRTYASGLPDWVIEAANSGKYPVVQEVSEQLEVDNNEVDRLLKQYARTARQINEIEGMDSKKWVKSAVYLELQKRSIIPQVETFEDLILYLGFFHNWVDFSQFTDDDLRNGDRKKLVTLFNLTNNLYEDTATSKFLSFNKQVMSRELIGLWIEKKLRGRIIMTSGSLLDEHFVGIFRTFFAKLRTGSYVLDREEGEGPRKAFTYDLKPIFELLSLDEIDYLDSLAAEYQDKVSVGQFILDLAELIHSKSATRGKLLSEIRSFAKNWLEHNYQAAFIQLKQSLFPSIAPQPNRVDKDEATPDTEVLAIPLITDLDRDSRVLSAGNLEGWKIFYAKRRRSDPGYLEEIKGESLQDREEALDYFIRLNKIPCSVEAGVLIRELNSVVVTPEEDERRKPREDVNGELYTKSRHGTNTRLLYQLSPEHKKIIFFIYFKRDSAYDFSRP